MNSKLTGLLMASVAAAGLFWASTAHAERVVVFGDSLSDGGFFPTVLPPQLFEPGEGSFTTNPDPVAPEVFANEIGTDVQTAYTAGGTPNGGFNYAIGGARIGSPNPLNPGVPLSVAGQVDTFLATGRTFGANDVVYIQGGGNDFFNFGVGPDAGNEVLFLASADRLAEEVARIDGLGAGTVVTLNVQSGGDASIGQFNARYEASLAALDPNALFFDTDALFNEIAFDAVANGGRTFGITNISDTACTPGLSSLFCSPSDYVTPDANETFLLADEVHPTGATQQIQGQAIASVLRAPQQIGELSYVTQAVMRGHVGMGEAAWRNRVGLGSDGAGDGTSAFATAAATGPSVFGAAGLHRFDNDESGLNTSVDHTAALLTLGFDVPFGDTASAGLFASYATGDGDFRAAGRDQGGFSSDTFAVTAYLRGEAGIARYIADATYGKTEYGIERAATLGPATRNHRGETDADYLALRAQVESDAFQYAALTFGPNAALIYDRVDVDGFSDRAGPAPTSTDIAFGDQDVDSLATRIGLFARGTFAGRARFYGRLSYEHAFLDGDRAITITPSGAPIDFTTGLREADDDYLSFEANFAVPVRENVAFHAGVSGEAFRGDRSSATGKIGLSFSF